MPVNNRALERRAGHCALASPARRIHGSLRRTHGDIERGTDRGSCRHLWLLDLLLGDVKASQPKDLKLHPRLTLCELDVNNEAEMQFVESHGAGMFEVGGWR